MTRHGFLALTLASLAAVVVAGTGSACSSSTSSVGNDDPQPGDDGGSRSDGSISASTGDVQALGKWCQDELERLNDEWAKDPTQEYPEPDHSIGADAFAAAPAAFASGASDIPLSPSKCTRLFVKREGGRVVSETLVRAPFKVDFDPVKNEIVYQPTSVAVWTFRDGGETFVGDYDGNGSEDVRIETTYEKQSVLETYAASMQVLTRSTAKVAEGGGVVDVKDEELVDGAMVETRSVTAPLLQQSCNPPQKKPPPPSPKPATGTYQGPTRACTDEERTKISGLLSTALQKGTGCLFAAGLEAESDQVLKTFVNNEMKVDCLDDAKENFWAANETGYRNLFPGKTRMIVFSGLFGQGQPFQEGTIGHELFHFFDVHDPEQEIAEDGDQIAKTDPVYACEALCFGSHPNTCNLAACQKKKLSTSWKGKSCEGTLKNEDIYKIERARGDGVTIASCGSGQQVGAICRNKSDGAGGLQVQFCTTEVECNTECGGPCESMSLSCLPECR